MSNIRAKIEQQFQLLGHILYQNRFKTLFFCFLVIGVLSSQIPKITVDTSTEGLLHKDDPGLIEYNEYRDQFSGSSIILVGIETPDIFTPKFLKKIERFHKDLENEVPHIYKITSLINVRDTRGEGDVLYVDGLLQDWKEKKIDFTKLKQSALDNRLYLNSILSEDSLMAAIVIETSASVPETDGTDDSLSEFGDDVLTTEESVSPKRYFSERDNKIVIDAINRVVARYHDSDFSISLIGRAVAINAFNIILKKDMAFLLMIASILAAIFLLLIFRRISGVGLPFIPVFSALISTVGLMAFFETPITNFTTILPSFLVAVGVANSIHILAIFYRHLEQGGNQEDSIAFALGHSGLPICLTSITTASGLLSFSFSELSALGNMGIFSAAGVILALLFTIVMLPASLALIPIRRKTSKTKNNAVFMDKVLLFVTNFSTSHPKKIIIVSIMVFLVSVFGTFQIIFSHNMLEYFPESIPIKQDTKFVDKKLKGTLVVRVVVDTGEEDGLHSPDILNDLEKFILIIEKINIKELFVGKVLSINNILKETNQALHNNDASFYSIPQDRKMVAQEFFLFENSGSDDLEEIVDSKFSKTSVTVKIPFVDYALIDDFISILEQEFHEVFKGRAEITVTGIPALMGRTIPMAQKSMALSYIIALIVISLMMVFMVGSFKFGSLCMIPNVLPIVIILGCMGLGGVALDMSALMIGSIAIGLVVDDTLHFMYNFRKYYELSGDVYTAVKETMLGTGRALLITSLVLSTFFFSLVLGILNNAVIFGFYTGLIILVALLADFILVPALLNVILAKK